MADPFSAARFVEILKAEGLVVHEYRSWRTHNRNHKGPWGPINGAMVHHTVTSGTAGTVRLCYEGYSTLPGPLCHGVIDKAGEVHLVGWGRTNHAGGGDPDVLRAVANESYGDTPPGPYRGNRNGVDGNAHFIGFECINRGDGRDPWPAAQLEAIEKACAAVLREYGWGAKSAIAHKEWSNDKIDPRGFSMVEMRKRIADRLGGAPGGQEDEVDIDKVAEAVVEKLLTADRIAVPWESDNEFNQVGNALESMWRQSYRTDLNVQQVTKALAGGGVDLDALAEKVAASLGDDIADVIADKLAARLAE